MAFWKKLTLCGQWCRQRLHVPSASSSPQFHACVCCVSPTSMTHNGELLLGVCALDFTGQLVLEACTLLHRLTASDCATVLSTGVL
jgi:hypothetical protein